MSPLRLWSLNAGYFVNKGLLLKSACAACSRTAGYSAGGQAKDKAPLRKAKTPQGKFDMDEQDSKTNDVFEKFPNDVNPYTKEMGGPRGPEPTRYGAHQGLFILLGIPIAGLSCNTF